MSGVAEAATVYSLVTGTIEIIKTAIEIWEAVKDKDKLPRQLRVVAEKLPSIQQLLATSEQQYQLKRLPDTQWATARQNVERCRTGCEDIRGIFDKAFPSNANAAQRIWTGTVTALSGRGKKAEELLQDVYKELEVLGQYHIVTNTELLAQIGAAVEELKGGEKPTYHHSGSGALSVHTGTGSQYTNSGEGHMFNGPVSHPSFYSVHHHGQHEGGLPPNGPRQRFRDSLWFPEIDQRRNEVKTACPDTLEWIFMEGPTEIVRRPWRPGVSFASWLRSSDSLYWISGKAGSGKSTLMAHLLNEDRTVEALQLWASECELLRLNYFFWRPGSTLQNSVEGLLRTIAFQLCKHVPKAVDTIMRGSQYGGGRLPSWTERTLVSAIKNAIQVAESSRQCISLFIDGLDEFLGVHDELVDLLLELQAFRNVKCCVASRPEAVLYERLKDSPHLRLQDLNMEDIGKFVAAKLTLLSQYSYDMLLIQETIVDCAEGVFLWAVLVTQSVNEGIRSGDCSAVLLERIGKLPKKLEHLFARMVENIEPYHRSSLAFYLQSVACISGARTASLAGTNTRAPTIALLTAARSSHPMESYKDFAEHCRQTELQVIGHCAGLLEIKDVEGGQTFANQEKEWQGSAAKFLVPALLGERPSMEDNHRKWQSCYESCPAPEILFYDSRFVGWVHRSAYEYVFPSDGQPSPAKIDRHGNPETLKLMAQTALELWMIMPSSSPWQHDRRSGASITQVIAMCAELAFAGEFQTAGSVMDVLYMHVSCFEPGGMPSFHSDLPRHTERRPVISAEVFWYFVCSIYPDYLTSRFDRMIAHSPTTAQLASTFRNINRYFVYANLDDQGVAMFAKQQGGWSSCIWSGHCTLSSPALLRLKILEVMRQRARPVDAGRSNDQVGYRTFLTVEDTQAVAVKCLPSMLQLDLLPQEEPAGFVNLSVILCDIMMSPGHSTAARLERATDSIYTESFGPDGPNLNRDTINGVRSLLTAVKARLYIGSDLEYMEPWPYTILPEHLLILSIPWELMLLSPGARYPHMFIDTASESKTVIPLDLSILCVSERADNFLEACDSIEFHLHADLAETLASMLAWPETKYRGVQPCLYGSDEDFKNLLKSILDDIRANKQSLNSMQQLVKLAHVDHFLRGFRFENRELSFETQTRFVR
ncbi:hypothetical protein LTR56_008113 [Elasticomyces elasticus]|nr:hypothetical protein LTR56_008113 [Elasticomyces elasticus]KAK3662865.1 hypothetical protein LTR22_006268 [Elasticomyces elasticus]KAK4930060.1 hypothetical protein LTR49_003388 [Elasticomyces elasticus]KAK5763558.1 hypothetical protein LTS12_006329 [Elasticomyces elasticus]